MISVIPSPLSLRKMRVLCPNGENQVEYGKPLCRWMLYLAGQELLKLRCKIGLSNDRKGYMDSSQIRAEQEACRFGSGHLVWVNNFKAYSLIVKVIARILDGETLFKFRHRCCSFVFMTRAQWRPTTSSPSKVRFAFVLVR